jgi:hypothetical protein
VPAFGLALSGFGARDRRLCQDGPLLCCRPKPWTAAPGVSVRPFVVLVVYASEARANVRRMTTRTNMTRRVSFVFVERSFGLACGLSALLLATAGGCGDVKSSGPAAKCVRIGDQCKLPAGPLGVCSAVDCKPDEVPPCMVCMSQH